MHAHSLKHAQTRTPLSLSPPQASVADVEDEENAGATYQLDMMRCLREVNVDNNTVGWCVRV